MKRLSFFLVLLAVYSSVTARELYVDASRGNDAVGYAENSATNPWASIGRAAWGSTDMNRPMARQAAQAGDTVIVAPGVYTARQLTNRRNLPAWNPVNNGKEGQPITFHASGRVVLRSIETAGLTNGGPVIGAFQRSYIVWDGFFVDEANIDTVPDTGPVVVWASDHIVIENLEIAGKSVNWAGDNHNGIRVEAATNFILRNNTIHGVRRDDTAHNAAAITMYKSSNGLIEGNRIFDGDNGIFIKGLNPGPFVVRGNNVYGMARYGFHLNQANFVGDPPGPLIGDGKNPIYVYRNAFHNNMVGVFAQPPGNFISTYAIKDVFIVNNTIVGNRAGFQIRPSIDLYDGIVVENNIIADTRGSAFLADELGHIRPFALRNNLYFRNKCIGSIGNGRCARSPEDWQRLGYERGAISGDPKFMDPARGDFRLRPGSSASQKGVDILNLNGQGKTAPINLGADLEASPTSLAIPPTDRRSIAAPRGLESLGGR